MNRLTVVGTSERTGRIDVYMRDHRGSDGRVVPIPGGHAAERLARDGFLDPNECVWVGGGAGGGHYRKQHLLTTLVEQLRQAANLFAVAPFRAAVCRRNPATLVAFEALMSARGSTALLSVLPLDAIRSGYGGPHCLTLPLLRAGGHPTRGGSG